MNAIWGQASYPWQGAFLRTLVENYGAGVNAVDFRTQFDPILRDALCALGAKLAFDQDQADLTGMSRGSPDGNLYVSDVLQKTMIAVAEKGVEAAAATAVVMMVPLSAVFPRPPPPVPIPMIVNRPYLLSVVDLPTGAILLLGQINDPSDSG